MRLFKIFPAAAAALGLALAVSSAHAQQQKGMMKESNIVETAKASGEFNTFTKALEESGLASELETKGPYTVFAPTDAAFQKMGEKKLDDLMKPQNKAELRKLLKQHIIAGKVTSGDLAGKKIQAETLEGSKVTIDGRKGVKFGNAAVTGADMGASNGVIHAVDRVQK